MCSSRAPERWIVGYGSLIWRPAFEPVEVADGILRGWSRRFWQGSPDHRGTPEEPGRVVTLVADTAGCTAVRVYRLGHDAAAVSDALDHREKAGYRTLSVPVALDDGRTITGSTYIALAGNPDWAGPAPLAAIAEHIAASAGPSGSNREYLERLHGALIAMGRPDEHVAQLVALLPNPRGRCSPQQ